MATDPKKRQQKLAKKNSKRKEKTAELKIASQLPSFKQSALWPLHACELTATWRNTMTITQIVVSRKSPQGHIAAAVFLVDLACLGVKNALYRIYPSEGVFNRELVRDLHEGQDFIPCSLELACKIIHAGLEYAHNLGFKPNKDFPTASLIFAQTDFSHVPDTIPTGGSDGKPLYISGPHDDPQRVRRILNNSVGEGNYHFFLGGPPMD
jgi:hypothetical protein